MLRVNKFESNELFPYVVSRIAPKKGCSLREVDRKVGTNVILPEKETVGLLGDFGNITSFKFDIMSSDHDPSVLSGCSFTTVEKVLKLDVSVS